MPLPGRKTGAKQPLLGGAESSSLVTSKVRLHMSSTLPWLTILLFVVPCHRAGDLTTEPTHIRGASDDKYTEKYQPSTKSFVAEWSFEKPLWRNVNSTFPQMREEAATWSDPDSGDWWLFGGHRSIMSRKGSHPSKEKAIKKNRFEKNMAKHDAKGGTESPLTTKYFSDLWHYQPSERLWTRIYPSTLSSIPAPGGPDHPLTRPILCGGGGKPSPLTEGVESDNGNRNNNNNTSNESLAEVMPKVGRVDGRVMAVYAPGSKPVDTVWLLEMNDTRLWTTYVCCDEDASMTEKSAKEDRKINTDKLQIQEKLSGRGSISSDKEKSVNSDTKNPAKNAVSEEGPLTFCPDFHTLTRPPITWCDKQSQALFALDIISFKSISQGQQEPHNSSSTQNNINETTSSEEERKSINWVPRIWRFDLGLTQWEHISVKSLINFSSSWKCGKDTSTMHWTSLGKCLIVLCPVLEGPSNLLHSLSMCVERDNPKLQSLGTIKLSQGASQARRWAISTVESSISGRRYLLLAYGRLLDLWVLEQGSINWSPLENIWQGAALKWFRANVGLYHLQIVEDGVGRDKKGSEEEEEEVEELEEGKALGIGHMGKISTSSATKQNGTKVSLKQNKDRIPANSKRKEGVMEVFMVNPRDGLDVSLREQGLFVIRISEDNGTIFGRKAEEHNKDAQEKEQINNSKYVELTTLPEQPMDEVLNLSSQVTMKKDDEMIKNEFTETSDVFYLTTTATSITKAEEGESDTYDQNQGDVEEDDDEWSAELVLETNGSSPVLNASLLALVEGGGNEEIEDRIGKENDGLVAEGINGNDALNHISTDESTNLNQLSAEKQPLIEASAIVNLEQDQADKMGVIRPLSIEENEMGRGSITLGAFGSEEESGYQGTILFFAVSFSMFMLFVVVAFIRRFVVINCHFASHHLPHRCRSNSSVLLKEPPPIRYSVIPDEVCYAGMNSTPMPTPGSPIPPSSIHTTLSRPLTT